MTPLGGGGADARVRRKDRLIACVCVLVDGFVGVEDSLEVGVLDGEEST